MYEDEPQKREAAGIGGAYGHRAFEVGPIGPLHPPGMPSGPHNTRNRLDEAIGYAAQREMTLIERLDERIRKAEMELACLRQARAVAATIAPNIDDAVRLLKNAGML